MTVKKILFIHHSTGGNLIKEGNLREEIQKRNPDIQFWDHSYNLFPIFPSFIARFAHLRGLTDHTGAITGADYNIVLSNNSPKEYAEIFSRDPDDPTLKKILGYDVIAFKNCYPTTKIASDRQLTDDIGYYKIIRDHIAHYPKKQFIILTPPPVRKEVTTYQNSNRAKKLIQWLLSEKFTQHLPNIHIFDFFTLLADHDGFLKKEYTRFFPWDSHPNEKANRTISPLFAKYLIQIAK